MRRLNTSGKTFRAGCVAACATFLFTACGGSGDPAISAAPPPPPPPPTFTSVVSFGDSLSDVGTYAVGPIRAAGGGKFTVNSPDTRIWIELIALQLRLPVPCAAQTGFNGDPAQGYSIPVTNFPECTGYAQGGSRVSNPNGTGNRAIGGVGALTVPVTEQIRNHLATHGGRFTGSEAVFVMAGGNDAITQLRNLRENLDVIGAINAMSDAGAELGRQVTGMIDAGAKYIIVVGLPDASTAPVADDVPGVAREGLQAMARTFNSGLRDEIKDRPEVLYVDAYARSQAYSDQPAAFGLTNVSTPACDLSPEKNPLGSSVMCTRATLVPGDVEHYEFADDLHPTPYGHQLLAELVSSEMAKRGWLR